MGDDVEAAGSGIATFDAPGNPISADWKVTVNASPGEYSYLCFIHPGMQGRFTVVDGDDGDVTTQAQINSRSAIQFEVDRREGLQAQRDANVVRFTGGAPGTRTYDISVGLGTSDLRVATNVFGLVNNVPGTGVVGANQQRNSRRHLRLPVHRSRLHGRKAERHSLKLVGPAQRC